MTRLLLLVASLTGAFAIPLDARDRSPTVPVVGQARIDLTGEWVFDVQTDAGGGSPSFVFTQSGEKLTGKYKGAFGEADLTGTVTGKTVKFSFLADAQGTAVTIVYEGEIESNSSIKGKVDLGGVGSGTFTGKRTK